MSNFLFMKSTKVCDLVFYVSINDKRLLQIWAYAMDMLSLKWRMEFTLAVQKLYFAHSLLKSLPLIWEYIGFCCA